MTRQRQEERWVGNEDTAPGVLRSLSTAPRGSVPKAKTDGGLSVVNLCLQLNIL